MLNTRSFFPPVIFVLAAVTYFAPGRAIADEPPAFFILDVKIVDVVGKRIVEHQDIRIVGDRISEISNHGEVSVPRSGELINADGAFAVSGLYDAHVHIDTSERLDLMLPELSGMPVSEAEIDDDLPSHPGQISFPGGAREGLQARCFCSPYIVRLADIGRAGVRKSGAPNRVRT